MLLCGRLNHLGKVQKLVKRFAVEEVSQTLAPAILELYKDFHQFLVVFELRIDHFDVLVILAKQCLEINERFLDTFGQISDSL